METNLVFMNTGVRFDPTIPLMPGQRWVDAKGGGYVKVIEIYLTENIDSSKYKLHTICDKHYTEEEMKERDFVAIREVESGSKGKYAYFKHW